MKITLYTIKDCAFSKQEKEYLNTNKLVFEEKDLEANKEFLTEMLAISNNFAGTPVTRVEKDDGTISVLKGFTKEEFDITFGFVSPADLSSKVSTTEEASAKAGPIDSTAPGQVNDTPIPAEMPPKVEDVKPVAEVEVVPPVETIPPAPVPTDTPTQSITDSTDSTNSTMTPDPLKSVMDDLQSKSQSLTDSTTPSIPDFPAK